MKAPKYSVYIEIELVLETDKTSHLDASTLFRRLCSLPNPLFSVQHAEKKHMLSREGVHPKTSCP
jgi:hypothetical protein